MSTKKRVADFQLTKDEDIEDVNNSSAVTSGTTDAREQPSVDTHVAGAFGFVAYSKINPFAALTAAGASGFKSNIDGPTAPLVSASGTEAPAMIPSFGFGAYANTNPFAAVTATVPPFAAALGSMPAVAAVNQGVPAGFAALASPLQIAVLVPAFADVTACGTSSAPIAAVCESALSFSSLPTHGSSFSSYTTKAPFAVSIPSPLTLSPKAQNPFSNPSPKHNPFVTIVESKDNLWSAASRSSCTSTTEAAGSSSFPFPSSVGSSSKSISTPTVLHDSIEDSVEKNAFGFESVAQIPSKSIGNGDDEEPTPAGGEEYLEDQVYGKVYPMPDNVTVITGEEDEDCVIQIRAKLFRLNVPGDTSTNNAEKFPSLSSSSSNNNLLNDSAVVNDLNEENKEKENDIKMDKKDSSVISTNNDNDNDNTELKRNCEKKSKVLGEWIEVGIGPVRILKQRETSHSPTRSESNKRMVMRREDKKGGKGYIIVKKQGDRTFHLTCLCENTISENNLSCDSQSLRSVDLSTYMFQTKQPQEADRLFEAINKIVTLDRNDRKQ